MQRNKNVTKLSHNLVKILATRTHGISPMPTAKARSLKDAEELLYAGINKVELAYDVGSDDLFRLATHWCDRGAKISRDHQHFVLSIKGFAIPPNH